MYHHQYIAISPDGTQIETLLNTITNQLKLCKSNNLLKLDTINYDGFQKINTTLANWSLTVKQIYFSR
jgi:hypothetical protein